jgi:serralysin
VIFTEIGYRSLDGTNRAPWDFQASAAPDAAEQADCYTAAYEVWTREPWMQGLFWWSWRVSPPGPGDTDYDPRGKPAEEIIRSRQ